MARRNGEIESVFDAIDVMQKLLDLKIKVRKQADRIMAATPPESTVHKEAKKTMRSLDKLFTLVREEITVGVKTREIQPQDPAIFQGMKFKFPK